MHQYRAKYNRIFWGILQIKPLSGPIEGGTLMTIEGSDLGLKEEDVRGKIHIGHVPCELVDYQVSIKVKINISEMREKVY